MTGLQVLWFVLIGVLFAGFFFLEGFDFGVGMALKTLAKNTDERDALVASIGPNWDANEVWLITAGGALFASMPMWYASLFSGFYIPLFLVVLALIFRGVSFEFRALMKFESGRNIWEWATALGSFFAPFILGMIFTAMVKGMPMDSQYNVRGSFFDFVNLFTIVGGVAVTLMSYIHGLNFIRIKTVGQIRQRAAQWAKALYPVLLIGEVIFALLVAKDTMFFANKPILTTLILAVIVIATLISYFATIKDIEVLSFITSGINLISVVTLLFVGIFPHVMIANNSKYSLLIENASSSSYTLTLMTWLAFSVLPIVLAYQIWSFYIFRKRLTVGATAKH
ncbi:cytochrome d ubiquinol oxidase subunit II [Periweissella beninensis]|uniref:Cytochrome d ubiquinol oxidase subunit II n=1 Tax=Periweissella beninensis TaxID=504936 RepID=A0ABT0VGW2_9LACO|nr:cytochrome d ubiquinol oxidase subunit II [Periweissella beninensis]MBM7545082.1 cytochrome d ubiquinol oxidase subunit II [Periweissella beninensis]MCM2436388.1 cytochrome d ubiquinol oxidase subunit II [Periweissella beninensis]MCT4395878.1 cytochrome d ubiquinol oxidase subunit II [Periweissella beninensis]